METYVYEGSQCSLEMQNMDGQDTGTKKEEEIEGI
jgi:hypothetical protein